MFNVLICGANGKMGKKVFECLNNGIKAKPICGIDLIDDFSNPCFPIYSTYNKVIERIDGIIDFSLPSSINNTLSFASHNKIPTCICTTGIEQETENEIIKSSSIFPICYSSNMSIGLNAICNILPSISKMLEGFDIDIIEKHHKDKKDIPSGTALLLKNNIQKNNIPIFSLRSGNTVGEHQIVFSGIDEEIIITHKAIDRKIFALGAIKALLYIRTKEKGLFNMQDLLKVIN